MIWTLVLVFALVTIAFFHHRDNEKNKAVLRHTIEVNLRILKDELDRKAPLVTSLNGADRTEADRLLSRSRAIVAEVEPLIPTAGRAALGKILGKVFAAMNDSTDLHRLLAKYSLVPTPEDFPLE